MRARLPLLLCVLVLAGCTGPTPPAGTTSTSGTTTPPTTPVTPWEPAFDGDRALLHVAWQVEAQNGTARYRIPATEGNDEVASYVTDVMEAAGYDVAWHHFNATYGCETTPMHNVVATRAGTSGKTLMFGAHYDSRPIADDDPDPANRTRPVLGAGDGASGVAVLLELARVLPETNDSITFLFFDGEDGGGYKGQECTDWILGSRAYAADMTPAEVDATRAFILVDMVGDPDLKLPWEMTSRQGAQDLQDDVYSLAARLGHGDVFLQSPSYRIEDDHTPFLERGIPALDLIHLVTPGVFPEWHHTTHDDLDHVSAESLAVVGQTLEAWVHGTE